MSSSGEETTRSPPSTGDGVSSDYLQERGEPGEGRPSTGALEGPRGHFAPRQEAPSEWGRVGAGEAGVREEMMPSRYGNANILSPGPRPLYLEAQPRPSQPLYEVLGGPPMAVHPAHLSNGGAVFLPANSAAHAHHPLLCQFASPPPIYSFAPNAVQGLALSASDPRLLAMSAPSWTDIHAPYPSSQAFVGNHILGGGRALAAAATAAAAGLTHEYSIRSAHPIVQGEIPHPLFSSVAPSFAAFSHPTPGNAWVAAPMAYQSLQPNYRRSWDMDAARAQEFQGSVLPAGVRPLSLREPESSQTQRSAVSVLMNCNPTRDQAATGSKKEAAEEASTPAESELTPASGSTLSNPSTGELGTDTSSESPAVGKPRRPLSAYNLYFKDERARLVRERQASSTPSKTSSGGRRAPKKAAAASAGGSSGVGFAQLARTISARWKLLDDETRATYEARAAIELERYQERKQAYVKAQQAALEAHRAMMEANVDDAVRQAYFRGYAALPRHPTGTGDGPEARRRPAP